MGQRNGVYVALGLVGLAAWMLYILACYPSWSPDSSKILFPYWNPETEERGVALFDRNTGTVRSIFVQSAGDNGLPIAQWDRDGSRAIVDWEEEPKEKDKKKAQGVAQEKGKEKTEKRKKSQSNRFHVLVFSVGSKGKTRDFILPNFEANPFPLPEVDGKLYVGGTGSLARLDLKTGREEIRDLGDSRGVAFFNRDTEHVVYTREGPESSDDREFGNLDQESLTLRPLFMVKKAALAPYGVKQGVAFLAFEPHGPRVAMIGVGEKEDKDFLVLCIDSGLQKVMGPEIPAKSYKLGNLQWASNQKTIYAMVVTPTEDKDFQQFSLGEIPTDGGPARLTPIVRVKTSNDDRVSLQIALSPDGSMIATVTAYLDKNEIETSDRGLFLVDLRDPERKVTKILFPGSQKAAISKPKE